MKPVGNTMMIRNLRSILSLLLGGCLLLTLLTSTSLGEEKNPKESEVRDLGGRWVVLLTNSMTRRQVTFDVKLEDGKRLRGFMLMKGSEEQKLDGRIEDDNKVKLWGVYYERSGRSHEYEFKGTWEGPEGEEVIKGTAYLYGKRYDFVAERATD